MKQSKRAGIEFAVDSNVYIQVKHNNVIRQEITIHNKATQRLVRGLMRFMRGEFFTSNRQQDESAVAYKDEAKNYVPCYINIGTGGVKMINTSAGQIPDYSDVDIRRAPLESWWNEDSNYVHYTDNKLNKEQTSLPRYAIGVMQLENDAISVTYQGGDIEQIVFATDVAPGTFNSIYGGTHDIYITELGLYPTSISGTTDLLARVILKNDDENPKNDQVLYVRPQDTIVINWIISIISLNDYNKVDEDSIMTIDGNDDGLINQTIPAGTLIEDNIPFDGTVDTDNQGGN